MNQKDRIEKAIDDIRSGLGYMPDDMIDTVMASFEVVKEALTTPQMEASDKYEMLTIKQRDEAEAVIDKLLDLIGVEHEWSSSFGFNDAIEAAEERISSILSMNSFDQALNEGDGVYRP
jgi:hypothetical protein